MNRIGWIVAVVALVTSGALASRLFAVEALAQAADRGRGSGPPATAATSAAPSGARNQKLGYFDYADPSHGMKARVLLPESLGAWAVENPWRDADKSLLKEPQVFVKANFQAERVPSFYGLVRVVYDLQGYDCGVVFTKLAALDGLALQRYSDTSVEGIRKGKLYVFEYSRNARNTMVGSKVLCDDKQGIETMVVAPNEAQYGDAVNTILKTVEMTIQATPAQ